MSRVRVALAGSTGSIGTQSIDVIAAEPERFDLVALGATGRQPEVLAEQVRSTGARIVAVSDPDRVAAVADLLSGTGVEVRGGDDAMASLADDVDVVVNGVVGFAGLSVTMATLAAGKRLALANKESLIAAGPVVQRVRATPGAELVPVDSEHGALHQCLRANDNASRVARLLLTASGGPFRGRSAADLATVTRAEALHHPTWSMGPKITIDSSTLMNKGLEVIEAHELFGAPAGAAGCGIGFDDIDVVVHPQSIVHSMVEFTDASTIAQLSNPDMRLPIGYALAWPDRIGSPFGRLDWTRATSLTFEPPDLEAFPCLALAYAAGRAGGTAPAWLNAANEVAVAAFLDDRIAWRDIAAVIAATLDRHDGAPATDVESVIAADAAARREADALIAAGHGRVGA